MYLISVCIIWIFKLISLSSSWCLKTQCVGKGKGLISQFTCPGPDHCAGICENTPGCTAYWHLTASGSKTCHLYSQYEYEEEHTDRFYLCEIRSDWIYGDCSVTCGSGVRRVTRYCCGVSCTEPAQNYTQSCYAGVECSTPVTSLCYKTQCVGKGEWETHQVTSNGLDDCAEWCDFAPGCTGYWYLTTNGTCRLYREYAYDEKYTDRYYTCTSEIWSAWVYGNCSVTCGNGYKLAARYCCGSTCVAPVQSFQQSCYGGNECSRIDGSWATWGSYTGCSVTCGGGTKTRSRTCTDPTPQNGGSYCGGSASDYISCNTQSCPIDGSWSLWSGWGNCNVTCGSGYRFRQRSCSASYPQHGGADCIGDDEQIGVCNLAACPVIGDWTQWTNYSECSVTCGIGIKSRNRSCVDLLGTSSQAICTGDATETDSCDEGNCPIDGDWSSWASWSLCIANATCGGGMRWRNRTCSDPYPQYGGEDCVGIESEEENCFAGFCPVDGGWSSWGSWEECSVTCGGGIHHRNRSCTDPAPFFGGEDCLGNDTDLGVCNDENCPVDGSWSSWSRWGSCNVTCGGGYRSRSRACSDPLPQYDGSQCLGPSLDHDDCNNQNCTASTEPKAECKCTCTEQNITLEAKIDQLKKELKVNTSDLSSTKRKLACADDERTSATQLGFIGASLLTICVLFIVSGDILSVLSYFFAK